VPLSDDARDRALIGREAEIIGTNDHLSQELPTLIELARQGTLDPSMVVVRTVIVP